MSGGTRSYEMARRLVSWGHEVHMITSWRENGRRGGWFESSEDGIHTHWLPVPYSNHLNYSARIRAFGQFALSAAWRAARLPADVIFASSTPLTIAVPAVLASRVQRVPMVFEVRDLWPDLPIDMGALKNPFAKGAARVLERFAYRRASAVVALSPGIRDGIVRQGVPFERVPVIPNSCDLSLFDPEQASADRFLSERPELRNRKIVVYAGTIGRINGVSYAVEIASEWRRKGSDACVVIVGDGAEKGTVQQEAERLDVLGKTLFMYPPVPKREMPDVLAASQLAMSLFIDLKAMWANSANKVFDALASGTPTVINYGGWQADLIREHGAGLVIPPRDPSKAAEDMEGLLNDETALKRARQAARSLAEAQFDRDVLARRLERVLINAVGGKDVYEVVG